MRSSSFGGRHELGQNFLAHRPTIVLITDLIRRTEGPILEIGPGDGALTAALAGLGRSLTVVEIDERRVAGLRSRFPRIAVQRADILHHPLDAPVVVGNIPFHLTTPILRRLLERPGWQAAVLLTQWEVARKRAGVGGGTMMTAQAAPWFGFSLHGRVPARHFRPQPSVDGGILRINRRAVPLVPQGDRRRYEAFVRAVFTASGGRIDRLVQRAARCSPGEAHHALSSAGIAHRTLPRDLDAAAWARLWTALDSGAARR